MAKSQEKKHDVDVRADDPAHAMERFNEGLRRVLSVHKKAKRQAKQKPRLR